MDENEKNTSRLTKVETTVMHLQNDYEALNEVVLENVRRIEQMAKTIQHLTNRLNSSVEPETERVADDEVPPHY